MKKCLNECCNKEAGGKTSMKKGKTILQLMQEQEPLNDYTEEEICDMYCSDGPHPCGEPCSWLELFTKRRFIEVHDNPHEKEGKQ